MNTVNLFLRPRVSYSAAYKSVKARTYRSYLTMCVSESCRTWTHSLPRLVVGLMRQNKQTPFAPTLLGRARFQIALFHLVTTETKLELKLYLKKVNVLFPVEIYVSALPGGDETILHSVHLVII